MTEQKKQPEPKKPERFEIKEAEKFVKKAIEEHKEWVKEMAKK